ncbi:hypothetical protein [Vibrio parahaemolyticus]|uniref:hypothetical protein n=1 Tax=Vibrio parahaemolyticus TaxID=670 RepID=UPI0011240A88|nr:hypothetical protein [Vibrio parahaemolyticus]MDF4592783.1 hypothetical protein [Vibrio parahaemolyticus]
MTTFTFQIEEKSNGSTIYWDARDTSNNKSFQVNINGYVTSGEFPEISDYLKSEYGLSYKINYMSKSPFKDSFDQSTQTWTFKRNGDTIIVNDIPRTVIRITKA